MHRCVTQCVKRFHIYKNSTVLSIVFIARMTLMVEHIKAVTAAKNIHVLFYIKRNENLSFNN